MLSWASWCFYVVYILVINYILGEEVLSSLLHFRSKTEAHKIRSLPQGHIVSGWLGCKTKFHVSKSSGLLMLSLLPSGNNNLDIHL